MGFERGGRADKLGNRYENYILAKLLLYTLKGQFISVEVEPLDMDAIEYLAVKADGRVFYYQCKGSNGAFDHWRMSDLKSHEVFIRAAQLIGKGKDTEYHFISPLPYGELTSLCDRARRCTCGKDFVSNQLSNKNLRQLFQDCASQLGKNPDLDSYIEEIWHILSRCHFELAPLGPTEIMEFEEHIGATLTGKASNARLLLEQLANDQERYGIPITANDILKYLHENGIYFRQLGGSNKELSRIEVLNQQFKDGFLPIADCLFQRDETAELFQHLQNGANILLCGKAGSGKSGCIQNILHQLNERGILCLGIRLDKHIPDGSADTYGKNLGLEQSPVHALASLAAGKICVLILDQLDSLRWTSYHSGTALDVCKEMILQASGLNKHENAHVCIILVSRTIDYETDPGLQSLTKGPNDELAPRWECCTVGALSDETVARIVGQPWETMSPRMKHMLHTASSLYVWTKLDRAHRSNNISSLYQLMEKWWGQIMAACQKQGLSSGDIEKCRNKLVQGMENNSTLSLPTALFADEQPCIDTLASNGLLVCQSGTVSFLHQSFLDYFVVADVLKELYLGGKKLVALLGMPDNQLPTLRYRLLMALQSLLDSAPNRFVQESKAILNSDYVRYYFKCAIFEVLGQCDNPNKAVFDLVDSCFSDEQWHNNVFQMVYLGHPVFVRHLGDKCAYSWTSPEGLHLLSSIAMSDPEYVASVITPLMFHSEEEDAGLFRILSGSTKEANCLFELRIQLLQHYPAFWRNMWDLYSLIETGSPRTIPLLELMLQQEKVLFEERIHFPDDEKLALCATQNRDLILEKLYPKLCVASESFPVPKDPWELFDFKHWGDREGYITERNPRRIVSLLRFTLQSLAKDDPEHFLSILEGKNHLSAVDHELMLCGMLALPEAYAERVLTWILIDFKGRIFDYTGSPRNYLSSTKSILGKFSPACSFPIFKKLEHTICTWSDSPERMRGIYQSRLNCRREGHFATWGYWGHLQKELLPSLDPTRLGPDAKKLLCVLERNPGIDGPHYYYYGALFSKGGFVSSPIDGYADRLSDKAWLKIIRTPAKKMGGKKWSNSCVEASHWAFSSAMGRQAKKEPERFAKLSLNFPDDTYSGYIWPILSALEKNEGDRVDLDLTCSILRCFSDSPNIDVANSWCRVIRQRADEAWPDDILDLLEKIATAHPIPGPDQRLHQSNSDPEGKSPHSLHQDAINCPRGCGAEAIAALLWEHRNLGDRFRSAVRTLSNDPNDSVRFATVSCAAAFYNIDTSFSLEIFKNLLEQDLRIVAAPNAWQLIVRGYFEQPDYYRSKLLLACSIDNEYLAKDAIAYVAALATYYNDDSAMGYLLSTPIPEKLIDEVANQLTSSFSHDVGHNRSVKLLTHLISTAKRELHSLSHLFWSEKVDIQRDSDFLCHLMGSNQGPHLLHVFLEYLGKQEGDLRPFAEVIAAAIRGLENTSDSTGLYFVSKLMPCVVRLFDQYSEDANIRQLCLDCWDSLFKSDIFSARQLTHLVEESDFF